MKSIIKLKNPSKESLLKVLMHLMKYGHSDFIVFSTFFREIENEINEILWQSGAKIVFLKSFGQDTCDCLLNVKGSLTDRFFIVYSEEILKFDLKEIMVAHKNSTSLSTLVYFDKRTVGAFFETEIFDYMEEKKHFEREVIPRVFEDGEVQIYI